MIDPKNELYIAKGVRTWRQLGDRLGISHGYLWQVAKGNLPASEKLLEKLGLRIEYVRIEATGTAGPVGKDRKRLTRSGNSA